jgi:hypothetical protein
MENNPRVKTETFVNQDKDSLSSRDAFVHEKGVLEWRSAVEGKTLASNLRPGPPGEVIDRIHSRQGEKISE